jgi:hypothetical protein
MLRQAHGSGAVVPGPIQVVHSADARRTAARTSRFRLAGHAQVLGFGVRAGVDVLCGDPWSRTTSWGREELMWTSKTRVCAGVKEGSQWEERESRALMSSGSRRR